MPQSSRLLVGCLWLLLFTACNNQPPKASNSATSGAIAVLLADNRLVTVRTDDGTLLGQQPLAAPPSGLLPRDAGHFLARSPDGTSLYALVLDTPGGQEPLVIQNRLVTLDAAGTHLRSSLVLPSPGDVYHSLAVGPRTGDIYAFGTAADGAPLVTVVDARTGAVRASWRARSADGRTWLVYQGALSADERELWLSYHGPDTTGIDVFHFDADGLHRCPGLAARVPEGSGCLGAHGGFVPVGQDLLVATGTPVVLELGVNGTVLRGWDTGLERNHLMEFAVAGAAGRLYAVGACGYVAGFSAVDLRGAGVPTTPAAGAWRWNATPRPPLSRGAGALPCGERLVLLPGPQLVVAGRAEKLWPALLFVDPQSGAIRRSVRLPAEPLDLIAAG